jgi:hypothetical protein
MVSRRDFLGQVLGTLVVSRVPFFAIPATPYLPAGNELERILDLLAAPRRLQKRCRLILRLNDDTLLDGPRMSHIEQPSAARFGFFAEEFEAVRSFNLKGLQLINWRNEFVSERAFSGGPQRFFGLEELKALWHASPANAGKTLPSEWGGDTLKASYIIDIGS